ncbi:MAG: GTPase [Candidatus Accumulibacter sp.]|uniref:GTPase n=1 Tax=Candidatus Accumulibacter proximus TaxID=2954385 RepID=A0A935Q326_9PROT|nr:GTPase [Candidatus Accumulibacter proximus]
MNEQEQKAILTLSLMAAFADGMKDEAERAELKRIADALAGERSINLAALYQDVLLKRVTMPSAVAALTTPEARQLAFEMAVCVCDADGVQSAAEQAFLADLRRTLALDVQQAAAYTQQAEAIAALPVATAADSSAEMAPQAPRAPASPAAGYASTMSESEMDQAILNAAILNGALELLPESLSTMAIIPLQMKLVYRIGKSYGFELDRNHIKDFLATLGVGLTSQYLEQAGRKLLGGLLGKVGGGMLRGIGKQAVSSGMSFASTYALGHVARRYYAGGRSFSTQMLREAFDNVLGEAKGLQSRYLPEMQARARTLDTAQIVDLVRRG